MADWKKVGNKYISDKYTDIEMEISPTTGKPRYWVDYKGGMKDYSSLNSAKAFSKTQPKLSRHQTPTIEDIISEQTRGTGRTSTSNT